MQVIVAMFNSPIMRQSIGSASNLRSAGKSKEDARWPAT